MTALASPKSPPHGLVLGDLVHPLGDPLQFVSQRHGRCRGFGLMRAAALAGGNSGNMGSVDIEGQDCTPSSEQLPPDI